MPALRLYLLANHRHHLPLRPQVPLRLGHHDCSRRALVLAHGFRYGAVAFGRGAQILCEEVSEELHCEDCLVSGGEHIMCP